MAVKTIWKITHSCGHPAERNLSDRAADRRAGFAEWLAKQECSDCWRAAKDGDEQDNAAWLEAKRAEEQAESDAWSERYRMPPMEGAARAVAWGVRCRHQVLAAAYTALVLEGGTSEAAWEGIEDAARTITRAGWWLDQRSSEPGDLSELLQAATAADRPTENPHF
ncbi:hypothetical protein G3I60_21195 [Streptomyces sp. SID13666]|uniref:hypothetical protein n=1 Tax=unclassified Streptomyces TaxID=2593676 RepID=UPI0013C23D98|nr:MULTISPECIES: hypothetical protein [unclassified Streptomyces]NEA56582.1 hypothetical protein [Streptomyces sp. SID13666]NEA77038.1 hypothetical protein [Streptomyces sp. SID13588]